MPVIQVTMTEEDGGATVEQKKELISRLTQSFVDVFGRGQKTCVVTLNEVSTDNFGVGGKTVTDIRKSS